MNKSFRKLWQESQLNQDKTSRELPLLTILIKLWAKKKECKNQKKSFKIPDHNLINGLNLQISETKVVSQSKLSMISQDVRKCNTATWPISAPKNNNNQIL